MNSVNTANLEKLASVSEARGELGAWAIFIGLAVEIVVVIAVTCGFEIGIEAADMGFNVFTELGRDEIGNAVKIKTTLEPPKFWDLSEPSHALTVVTIEINRATDSIDRDALSTWHDIFLQAIIYPPPKAHPLYQMLQELRTPIQSS